MKVFKTIETLLIWVTLLAFGGAFASLYLERMIDPFTKLFVLILFIWGFLLWRKMKRKEGNEDHDAFLWLEALAYGSIVTYPLIQLNAARFGLPDVYGRYIIGFYILFPFLGTILALLRLRRDFSA